MTLRLVLMYAMSLMATCPTFSQLDGRSGRLGSDNDVVLMARKLCPWIEGTSKMDLDLPPNPEDWAEAGRSNKYSDDEKMKLKICFLSNSIGTGN